MVEYLWSYGKDSQPFCTLGLSGALLRKYQKLGPILRDSDWISLQWDLGIISFKEISLDDPNVQLGLRTTLLEPLFDQVASAFMFYDM